MIENCCASGEAVQILGNWAPLSYPLILSHRWAGRVSQYRGTSNKLTQAANYTTCSLAQPNGEDIVDDSSCDAFSSSFTGLFALLGDAFTGNALVWSRTFQGKMVRCWQLPTSWAVYVKGLRALSCQGAVTMPRKQEEKAKKGKRNNYSDYRCNFCDREEAREFR